MEKGDLERIAYQEIKNAIITGVYPLGIQVVEETVANQLNMSRSPVRIAMKQLQAEGFLERRDNKRIYVTVADVKRTLDALYLREALEGMAARLAAENRTPEEAEQLNHMITSMEEQLKQGSIYDVYQSGIDLHKKLFEMSGNDQLARIGTNTLEQEAVFSYRSLRQSLDRISKAHQEHTKIVQAVIAGLPDEAEKAARQHVHKLIDQMKGAHSSDHGGNPLALSRTDSMLK